MKEFLEFWTPRAEIRKVCFSLFTPQIGDQLPEMLLPEERSRAIAAMGLAAVAAHKLGGVIPVGAIFTASVKIGQVRARRSAGLPPVEEPLRILS